MRRALVVALGIGAAGIFGSPHVLSHANFSSSAPGDGASLDRAPEEVEVTFTEEPDPALSRIEVFDTEGGIYHQGPSEPRPGQPLTLYVGVEPLDDGVYTVSWRVVSKVDGHLTSGAFAFGIGVSPGEIEPAEIPEVTSGLSPLEVAGRWGLYVGAGLALGAGVVYAFAFRPPPRRARMVAGSAVFVAVAGTLVLAFAQLQTADVAWRTFLSTSIGGWVIWRLAALTVAAAGVILLPRRTAWMVLGAASMAAIVAHVSGGHAASGSLGWAKVSFQVVHVGAVGVWIGGLTAVLAGIGSVTAAERADAVRRFSRAAGVALAVVVVTGTVRAVNEVASWGDLLGTSYGRVIVAKVALLGVLVALGFVNRTSSVERVAEDQRPLRRVSAAELVVAGCVLALTGMLAGLAPARGYDSMEESSVLVEGADFARSVDVRMEITPGRAGANTFDVWVDVRRGAEVEGVALRMSSLDGEVEPSGVELEFSDGRWTRRSSALALPGRWRAVVVVDRGAETVEVPLVFHTTCPAPRTQEVGGLRLQDIDLASGRSLQAYVDPATPGNNEVHFTFFGSDGREIEVAGEPVVRASDQDESLTLDVRRVSEGHFLGGGRLVGGRWTFSFAGETKDSDLLNVCFTDEIG